MSKSPWVWPSVKRFQAPESGRSRKRAIGEECDTDGSGGGGAATWRAQSGCREQAELQPSLLSGNTRLVVTKAYCFFGISSPRRKICIFMWNILIFPFSIFEIAWFFKCVFINSNNVNPVLTTTSLQVTLCLLSLYHNPPGSLELTSGLRSPVGLGSVTLIRASQVV